VGVFPSACVSGIRLVPVDGNMKRPGVGCGVDVVSSASILRRFGDGGKRDVRYAPFSGSGIESWDSGCVKIVKSRLLLPLSSISSSSSDIEMVSRTFSR